MVLVRTPLLLLSLLTVAADVAAEASATAATTANAKNATDHRALNKKNGAQHVYEVLILGAGWAGLAAGKTLVKSGIRNIQVLEGKDYVGGRCKTEVMDGGKKTYEAGCQWIHTPGPKNPLSNIAKKNKALQVKSTPFDKVGYWSNHKFLEETDVVEGQPHRVPTNLVGDRWDKFYRRGFKPYQRKLQNTRKRDTALRNVADEYIGKNGVAGDDRLVLEYAMNTDIEIWYGADLAAMSLWWWDADAFIESGGLMANSMIEQGPNKGFSRLISDYAKPIKGKISLGSEVLEVDYSNPDAAVVTYRKNGKLLKARAKNVMVTASLGVLKAGNIKFKPKLPAKKRKAIKFLGMGNYGKVVVRFADDVSVPWPNDLHWLTNISPPEQNGRRMGRYTSFFNMEPTTGDKVLVTVAGGAEADRIEQMPESELRDEVMAALRVMYGQDAVPEPVEILKTKWRADKFTEGAFSYKKVGSKPKDRKVLGSTVKGRLYFAGEATSFKYAGYAHGALLTGEEKARSLARKIKAGRRPKQQSGGGGKK